jgi:hypothetical protein
MHADVAAFVKACLTCQQVKDPTHLPYDLLQPLPVPSALWEDISLDFITGLPSFQNNTVILVVVDRFSKAAHFGMLPTSFSIVKVAELFIQMICRLHGMPKSIVSDRDPIFMSRFWQELFKLNQTKLCMSSAYHLQSDGQTEIVNKLVQQYLRAFVHDHPKLWGRFLQWAEWNYNTAVHSSTGLPPFQVVYGKPPPTIADYVTGSSLNEDVDMELTTRDVLLSKLRSKLLKAQTAMKFYADKHRMSHPFKISDLDFVKLRPYRQISVGGS